MDLGLSGRVALVCGGGRGIGRVCAEALAREGADVAVLARTASELDATADAVRAHGRRALALPTDVKDTAQLDAALERLASTLGSPTLLVLGTAALWQPRRLHSATDAEIRNHLEVDLLSALTICRRVLPGMVKAGFGRIVALGSLAARTGISGGTEYAVIKAALEGLVRGLALDYGRRGLTANVVSLGFVETERLAGRVLDHPERREKLVQATTRKQLVQPEEAADVVAFLCSARAAAITGSVIEVTAGAHLNNLW